MTRGLNLNLNGRYLIIIIISVTLIWLSVLTFLFVRIIGQYKSLIKGVNEGYLKGQEITEINKRLQVLEKEGLGHVQRIGMLRFNPFDEAGGDNSFTICLLNGKSDGILLTGLHTREKTRMYAKKIENGKSKYELSKEEKKVIQDAK